MDNTTNTEAQLEAKIELEGDLEYFGTCTQEQKEFFNSSFPDISFVKTKKLHCTSCDKHLGSGTTGRTFVHPILQVLLCKSCLAFYNSGEFLQGDDGSELHCRWCGQGGQVYCCSKCPSVFCKSCVKRNLSKRAIKVIEDSDEWACFRCDSRPLWELQANCWALKNYMRREKRAVGQLDCTTDRRKSACTDHSSCCTQPDMKEDTPSSEYKTRKRRRSSKTDKTALNHDPNTKTTIKRAREERKDLFGIANQEQAEVVCTPDIFPCFEENVDEPSPPPPPQLPRSAPKPVQNGTQGKPSKPRISVRPPETMMQSPGQPMFPTMLPSRPILCQIPGPSLTPHTGVAIPISMDVLTSGKNVIQLNDGRLLSFNKPSQASFGNLPHGVIPVPVSCISSTMPPPLVPPVQRNPPPMKTAPARGVNRGPRYGVPPPVRTATPAKTIPPLTAPPARAVGGGGNPSSSKASALSADQTLSSLLQKKLLENPNINRVRMRKIPDWFHVNVQSCLVIARTFISQLMDLQSKAQQMQDSSYDEVKNMHVQLSFLISAIIGKYKNNQLDLNLQLSEWTDALCKSLDSALVDETPPKPATTPSVTPVIASVTSVAPTKPPAVKDPGKECRASHKDIFNRYKHDRKLLMDPVVVVHKFKFQKSTNVFKVKPKYKPIIRTPAIDPNVVQTIDSDSDDDDCTIIPGPDPLLIDLDSVSENGDQTLNGNLSAPDKARIVNVNEQNSEDVDDPAAVVDKSPKGKSSDLSMEVAQSDVDCDTSITKTHSAAENSIVKVNSNVDQVKTIMDKIEDTTIDSVGTSIKGKNDTIPDQIDTAENKDGDTAAVSIIVQTGKVSHEKSAVSNSKDISHSNEATSSKNNTASAENDPNSKDDLSRTKSDNDSEKNQPSGDKAAVGSTDKIVAVEEENLDNLTKANSEIAKPNLESSKIMIDEGVPKEGVQEMVLTGPKVLTQPSEEKATKKSEENENFVSKSPSDLNNGKDNMNSILEPMDCDNKVESVTGTNETVLQIKTDEKMIVDGESGLNSNGDSLVTSSE